MKIRVLKKKSSSPSSIGEGDIDTVVLFIHGLFGSYWTWNKFAGHLKNTWKEVDAFDLKYDEYYENQGFFYTTPILKWLGKALSVFAGPDIDGLSDHLKAVIEQRCRDYDHIVIIAHSMGGIVARKYIVNRLEAEKNVGNVKALITYATPHHGSKWANFAIYFCFIVSLIFNLNAKQVRQLRRKNKYIDRLNESWGNLGVDKKLDFKRVVGLRDWIVDIESSSYFEDNNVYKIAHKNHFSIINPVYEDVAFLVTYNYLKDFHSIMEARRQKNEEGSL